MGQGGWGVFKLLLEGRKKTTVADLGKKVQTLHLPKTHYTATTAQYALYKTIGFLFFFKYS